MVKSNVAKYGVLKLRLWNWTNTRIKNRFGFRVGIDKTKIGDECESELQFDFYFWAELNFDSFL